MKTLTRIWLVLFITGCATSGQPTVAELRAQLRTTQEANDLLKRQVDLLATRTHNAETRANELARNDGIKPQPRSTDKANEEAQPPAAPDMPPATNRTPAPAQNNVGNGFILASAPQPWYPSPGELMPAMPTVVTAGVDQFPPGYENHTNKPYRIEYRINTGAYYVAIRAGSQYVNIFNWQRYAGVKDAEGFVHDAPVLPPGHDFTVYILAGTSTQEGVPLEFEKYTRTPFRGDITLLCTYKTVVRDPVGNAFRYSAFGLPSDTCGN